MKMGWSLIAVGCVMVVGMSCSVQKVYTMQQRRQVYGFEQVNFNDLLRAYLVKTGTGEASVEGIYSVTAVVTKTGKRWLSATETERIINRRENYQQVAIIKDIKSKNREYLEIPLETGPLPSYSVRGEFFKVIDNSVAVYQRLEERGRSTSYTFSFDKHFDVLEGVRAERKGKFTITEKLTYLKVFPR